MKRMKKNKITAVILTVLTVIMMASLMPLNVFAAASAQLFDVDQTTGGNWVDTYGSDGHIIITSDNSLESIPSYAKVTFYSDDTGDIPTFWEWWDTNIDPTSDAPDVIAARQPGTLYTDSTKTKQLAACYYSSASFTATVDVGSDTKIVSLYMLDYDQDNVREGTVTVFDETGKTVLYPAVDVNNYSSGWYLKYKVSGKVMFEFDGVAGPNVVLSGIFFDPATAKVATPVGTVPTTAAPTTTVATQAPTTAAPAATTAAPTAAPAKDNAATTVADNAVATTASSDSSTSSSSNSKGPIIWTAIAAAVVVVIIIIIAARKRKKK